MRRAAEQEYGPAQTQLGLMLKAGDGVPKNLKKAASWFRRAASHGETEAMYELSLMYKHGGGVRMYAKLAAKWLRRAQAQADYLE